MCHGRVSEKSCWEFFIMLVSTKIVNMYVSYNMKEDEGNCQYHVSDKSYIEGKGLNQEICCLRWLPIHRPCLEFEGYDNLHVGGAIGNSKKVRPWGVYQYCPTVLQHTGEYMWRMR